jgi:hypothetical protein
VLKPIVVKCRPLFSPHWQSSWFVAWKLSGSQVGAAAVEFLLDRLVAPKS